MLYGSVVWDPVLIIAQIISLQCLFYLTLGVFDAILIGPFIVGKLTAADILGWQTLGVNHFPGWMNITANLVTACLGAVYLVWIVERAKKCLDFAFTIYLVHFIACWIYSGFPSSLVWWMTQVAGLFVMFLLGKWLCVRRELADIPINAMRGRLDAMRGGETGGGATQGGGSGSVGVGIRAIEVSSSGSGPASSSAQQTRGAVSSATTRFPSGGA